jgi:hypothetical protein
MVFALAAGDLKEYSYFPAFAARTFAHLAFCAAPILRRAEALILRFGFETSPAGDEFEEPKMRPSFVSSDSILSLIRIARRSCFTEMLAI